MKSLQCIDFNIFAEIITDMYKKMLFLGTNARIADVALTEVGVVTRRK